MLVFLRTLTSHLAAVVPVDRDHTQAASFGKPAGAVFIVVLRVAVKAALPAAEGDLNRLRLGISIHLAVAAAVLLVCVLLPAFAIPYLVDVVQQTESPDFPPGRQRIHHFSVPVLATSKLVHS